MVALVLPAELLAVGASMWSLCWLSRCWFDVGCGISCCGGGCAELPVVMAVVAVLVSAVVVAALVAVGSSRRLRLSRWLCWSW